MIIFINRKNKKMKTKIIIIFLFMVISITSKAQKKSFIFDDLNTCKGELITNKKKINVKDNILYFDDYVLEFDNNRCIRQTLYTKNENVLKEYINYFNYYKQYKKEDYLWAFVKSDIYYILYSYQKVGDYYIIKIECFDSPDLISREMRRLRYWWNN